MPSHLRKNTKFNNIPVITYTTPQAEEDAKKAREAGATYFLTKPAKFRDLVHAFFGGTKL